MMQMGKQTSFKSLTGTPPLTRGKSKQFATEDLSGVNNNRGSPVVEDCKEEAMIKTETDDDMGKTSGNVSPYPLSREESKAMKYDVKFLPDWIVPADRRDQLLVLEVPFKLPATPSVMATPIPPPPKTFRPAPIVEHVETRAAGSWMCNDCTFTNGNMCAFCRACGATLVLEFYPCEI
jgi:hypothetical protein